MLKSKTNKFHRNRRQTIKFFRKQFNFFEKKLFSFFVFKNLHFLNYGSSIFKKERIINISAAKNREKQFCEMLGVHTLSHYLHLTILRIFGNFDINRFRLEKLRVLCSLETKIN